MRLRYGSLAVPWLFAAACSSGSPAPAPGTGPGSIVDQTATGLGMAVMATDEHGVPRLMRAIVPRAGLAGATPEVVARDHVAALAPLWVRVQTPMALVDGGAQTLRNGATVVRLVQQVDGAVVDGGELRVLLHADRSLAAVSGTLLPAVARPVFVSSAGQAVERALGRQYGRQFSPQHGGVRPALAVRAAGQDGWQAIEVAATPQVRITEARARRTLAVIDDQRIASWEVELFGEAAPDPLSESVAPVMSAHSYLVADAGGAILRDVDLDAHDAFLYRVYAEPTGNRRPFDSALASFAPHPTGVPDGSGPALAPANLVGMEAFNRSFDRWLPDDATTTAGNNAEAFADLDGNNAFTPGLDIRPEVQSGRLLNYTYRHDLEPLATPDQSRAAAVNAFFLVNWMHDWWYDSGFTEATRNAQLDNFGRGGVANDRLLIAAQAGATVGSRNNASMATPADGARPRMRMFLWTAGADTALTGPAGAVHSEPFSSGPRTFSVTGEIAIGSDATAPADDGCQAITGVAGKIALLTYAAQCNSQVSVTNARAAGAIAVILADGELDQPRGFGGSAAANLPGLVVGRSDGLALKALLATGGLTLTLVSNARGAERDGDLDNTVVAHEWGHYLHHRLANCGASQQCGGMSEGWGDFNALLLLLRDGDNRNGVYAMAPYAIADGSPDTAYFGLRRFPYSRDRSKNDLSFRHIGDENPLPTTTPGFPGGVNSEVHNTGEVWATIMWEVLNVLADQHGVTVARRRMSDYVVAGLLLAPTNATFTEQRDAILAGASALDTDDMLVMAAAFAGRGLGSCAVSPARTSPTNQGAIESRTIAAKLALGTPVASDDGARADHDGVLEPGESGSVRLAIANGGVLAAEQVTLTAVNSGAGVEFGTAAPLALLPAFATAELTIPVRVAPTVLPGTTITVTLRVAAEDTCTRAGLETTVTLVVGPGATTGAAGAPVETSARSAPVIRAAPEVSLRAFDAACVAQDAP